MRESQYMTRIVALSLLTFSLLAGPLTDKERETAVKQISESAAALRASIKGVSDAQWSFKPGPESWSIGECVEHLVAADELMFTFASQTLIAMPTPTGVEQRTDEQILKIGADRSQKTKTGPQLEPKNKFATRAAALEAFDKGRAKIAEYLRTSKDDLRAHGMKTPGGYTDCYQTILSIAAHGRRHAAQIDEVKASAGYPKQ